MRACNQRPPEGHPLHGWGVACHLPQDHLDFEQPHAWDIEAAAARHEILTAAMDRLRERFPGRAIARFDAQLPHPLIARDVDPDTGARGRPYRAWELPGGPWLVVTYADGGEYAIWKQTGDVYEVGPDGAVGEDPLD
jgi:hypothetical protein